MSAIKVGDLVMLVGTSREWAPLNGLCTTVLRPYSLPGGPCWEIELTADIRAALPSWGRMADRLVALERQLRRIDPPDWNALATPKAVEAV